MIERDEVLIRLVWPLLWGAGVCAVFLGAINLAASLRENLLGWTWAVVAALAVATNLLERRYASRVHLVVRGIDLLAPELAGERFAGLLVAMVALAVVVLRA